MENSLKNNLPPAEIGNILPSHENMIAITSGKGGVGKTWFSVTLAHALSLSRKKVLFFDGDLGLSNIDNQMGLMTTNDLSNAITGMTTLNQIINTVTIDKIHFDVIAGRSGSSKLSSMPIGRLQILAEDLSLLASKYNKVLLDLGNGIDHSIRILSGIAKNIIVLCTDDTASLTEAYGVIKAISSQYPKCKISVVVNQATTIQAGERTYETLHKACHSFLGISPSLLGVVRKDGRVRDTIRNQMTIISRYPTSEAVKDVIEIARKL